MSVSEPGFENTDSEKGKAILKILDAAESLFASRGYNSVTLRDIAQPLGMTHASLYYHFPGGKEELFETVTERNIRRHGQGLADSMEKGGGPERLLRGSLRGAAAWLLSQPPMDLVRMTQSDLGALPKDKAYRLMDLVYALLLGRIQEEFDWAAERGQTDPCDAGLLAGGLFGMIESLHAAPEEIVGRTRLDMANDLLDIMLKGIGYRNF